MEKNSELDVDRWIEERLSALAPDNRWQPDTAAALARLREKQTTAPRHTRRWIWAAAASVMAGVCLVALPSPKVLAQRCIDCSAALWQSIAQRGAPRVDPAGLAPDFSLDDQFGRTVQLSAFRGKVVLLNFWATWCPPCRVEMPWFVEFQKAYGNDDFAVLGVSLDEDGWDAVRPYLDRAQIDFRVMLGGADLAARYGGIESLPSTLLIDRAGRIAWRHSGLTSQEHYQAEIEKLLK